MDDLIGGLLFSGQIAAELYRMKENKMYAYFDRYRGYIQRVMNLHEIEKAIIKVRGARHFDKRIRAIWQRLLK